MRQTEDVGNVIQAEAQRSQAEQDPYVEDVAPQVVGRLQGHLLASEEHAHHIEHDEHDGRTGILPHASPLQEGWHGDAQGEDGLQIAYRHQIKHHERMHGVGRFRADGIAEEGTSKQGKSEDSVYPSQTEVLHTVAGKQGQHGSDDKVCGGAAGYDDEDTCG